MSTARYTVGIDIGGTKTAIALVDASNQIVDKTICPTVKTTNPHMLVTALAAQIKLLVHPRDIAAIGVAIPGTIDERRGILLHWSTFQWTNVPFAALLQQALHVPVYLVNDANAATLGEFYAGAARGYEQAVYITMSTSVGGGIIINGELLRGATGLAGEIGHIAIELDGAACHCGKKGCLQSYASGEAITAYAKLLANEQASSLRSLDDVQFNTQAVFQAALHDDNVANTAITRAVMSMAEAIKNIIHLLNPEIIVLGGGVIRANAHIVEPIREAVNNKIIASYEGSYRIERAALFEEAAIIGAAIRSRQMEHL